jgi:pimeloyl-ACP methyl ester carboxylesterase
MQDAIDLADALDLERFAVVGHDWGARIAYTLAARFPKRVTAVARWRWAISLAVSFEFPISLSRSGFGTSAGCNYPQTDPWSSKGRNVTEPGLFRSRADHHQGRM